MFFQIGQIPEIELGAEEGMIHSKFKSSRLSKVKDL